MDVSMIKPHLPVYVDGPGGLAGASEVHIGNVDKVEDGKDVKMTKANSPDGEPHWFPLEWIRTIDERAIFLNKSIDEVLDELVIEQSHQA